MVTVGFILLSLVQLWTLGSSALVAKGILPLNGENRANERRTIPGCHLGDQFHSLEDTWQPALEPVGVMHCIICQCQPVIKKGILQQKGRVNCRNIKHDCPQTMCPQPRLIPGQCCKLCQGQDPLRVHAQSLRRFPSFRLSANTDRQIASPPKALHHRSSIQTKEYVAILVGSSAHAQVRTSSVARGHFRLRDSSVYISIQYEGSEQPRQFRIRDERGSVLYLKNFPPTISEATYKLCGVWQPLSGDHIQSLNQGRLVALISTAETPNGLIAGNIVTHRALSKETFSAILHPQQRTGSGGLMMMTISGNGDVNFIVKLTGNHLAPGQLEGQVRVSFEKNNRVVHESAGELMGRELEFAEVWSDLSTRESRMLARGAINVRVVTSQGETLRGDVIPKQSCTVLHSVLSLRESLTPVSVTSGAAGAALIHLSPGGQITYSVELNNVTSQVTSVSIETAPNKRGKSRRMCSVSLAGEESPSDRLLYRNGTCDRFNARHVHALLLGDMYVNIATHDHTLSALRGKIHELLYNPDIDKQTVPGLLLSGAAMIPPMPADVAGSAWALLDSACALHFELVVSGMAEGEDAGLLAQIVSLPFVEKKAIKFTIKEFVGNVARGIVPTLTPEFYQLLNSDRVLLRIATKSQPEGAIGTKLYLPNRCVVKNSKSSTLGILNDQEDHPAAPHVTKCVVGDVTYKDGDVWVPRDSASSCVTCQCKHGKEECHQSVCPSVTCDTPVTPPGECCPQCIDVTPTNRCYFDGDKRWHAFGTKWHPYMPPFGYMTCAICMCTENGTGVHCTRPPCPALTCPESAAIRKKPSDCCKVCPKVSTDANSQLRPDQPQADIRMTGSCPFQGYRYTNGATWNPRVQPFGRLACVTCRCVHGATSCLRQKCPKLRCHRRVRSKDSCCSVCAEGSTTSERNKKKHRRRGLSARSSGTLEAT